MRGGAVASSGLYQPLAFFWIALRHKFAEQKNSRNAILIIFVIDGIDCWGLRVRKENRHCKQ